MQGQNLEVEGARAQCDANVNIQFHPSRMFRNYCTISDSGSQLHFVGNDVPGKVMSADICILMKYIGFNPFDASCFKFLLFEGSAPYWSNPPFLIFDIRQSARMSKIKKMVSQTSMALCKALRGSAVKGSRMTYYVLSCSEPALAYVHSAARETPPITDSCRCSLHPCLSVCPSVCHTSDSRLNGSMYQKVLCIAGQSDVSHF